MPVLYTSYTTNNNIREKCLLTICSIYVPVYSKSTKQIQSSDVLLVNSCSITFYDTQIENILLQNTY